jgi:hypothetical protein
MRGYTYASVDPMKAAKAYTMERALQSILTLDQINFYV